MLGMMTWSVTVTAVQAVLNPCDSGKHLSGLTLRDRLGRYLACGQQQASPHGVRIPIVFVKNLSMPCIKTDQRASYGQQRVLYGLDGPEPSLDGQETSLDTGWLKTQSGWS